MPYTVFSLDPSSFRGRVRVSVGSAVDLSVVQIGAAVGDCNLYSHPGRIIVIQDFE